MGLYSVPAELDGFPRAIRERYGPTLQFANRTWAIKDAYLRVALADIRLGGDYYSTLSSDVWADGAGLHLTLHQYDGSWWATEVTLLGDYLGYGTYVFGASHGSSSDAPECRVWSADR
jgi:hypothetical protein